MYRICHSGLASESHYLLLLTSDFIVLTNLSGDIYKFPSELGGGAEHEGE